MRFSIAVLFSTRYARLSGSGLPENHLVRAARSGKRTCLVSLSARVAKWQSGKVEDKTRENKDFPFATSTLAVAKWPGGIGATQTRLLCTRRSLPALQAGRCSQY